MTFEQAASFLVTYMSAWHGLRTLAQTKPGETLLVHAAAGGVGTACAQLGRHWGCTVIGTASTNAKMDIAVENGVTHAFNYTSESVSGAVSRLTSGRGVDVVMDSVGGRVMRQSWKVLAPMGRYVLYGFAAVAGKKRLHYLKLAREILSFPLLVPTSFPSKNVSFMGFNLYFLADRTDLFRSAASELLSLFRRGKIAPVIGRIFPFEEVVEAHAFLQSRQSIGKVLLRVR
jgi:NADPH:quinone reductase-like Zn-dependent oxidoreductase